MTDRELMQMALDMILAAIKSGDWKVDGACDPDIVIEALRARLAQPEPKPWGYISHKAWKMPVFVEADDLQAANLPHNNPNYTPVYKAPPQRDEAPAKAVEWQGLTDEETNEIAREWQETPDGLGDLCRAIEAKLKEKNT